MPWAQSTTEDYIKAMMSLGYLVGALSPVNHIGYKRVMVSLGYLIGALNPVNYIGLYQDYGFTELVLWAQWTT